MAHRPDRRPRWGDPSLNLKHVDIDQGQVDQDARQVKTKFSKSFTTRFFLVGDDQISAAGVGT